MRVTLMLVVVALAGCASAPDVPEPMDLAPGKGAISGLLVDDRYRPIELTESPETEFQSSGFVLNQQTGEQATTDANGAFSMTDLEPGVYMLRATVDGHEVTPGQVTVKEGEFAEVTLVARRVTNEGTVVVTQEYSGFVPCASGGLVAFTIGCTYDRSGDSYRPGPILDFTIYEDLQYIVIEATANQGGDMSLIFREDDVTGSGGNSYGRADTEDYDAPYMKLILADTRNVEVDANATAEPYAINPFPNDFTDMESLVFYWGEEPLAEVPAGPFTVPLQGGARAALEFDYVITMFLGPPEVDLQEYCVLCQGQPV